MFHESLVVSLLPFVVLIGGYGLDPQVHSIFSFAGVVRSSVTKPVDVGNARSLVVKGREGGGGRGRRGGVGGSNVFSLRVEYETVDAATDAISKFMRKGGFEVS